MFFFYYGIKGGLIEKRILSNPWTHVYVTWTAAVVRGYFYIFLGALFLIVLVLATVRTIKCWLP